MKEGDKRAFKNVFSNQRVINLKIVMKRLIKFVSIDIFKILTLYSFYLLIIKKLTIKINIAKHERLKKYYVD